MSWGDNSKFQPVTDAYRNNPIWNKKKVDNMHTFKTKLLGPEAEVEGVFEPAEPETMTEPGYPAEFAIESITDKDGIEYEIDCICAETLKAIEQEAFDDAESNREQF